ncbi:MAG: hypothetical protein OEY66_04355 [Gammaproteobacteria bacterium]|nr:hypothetical protein [Gammaproteobacteria bacterium]
MRITLITLSLLLPAAAFAQEMPAMNEADIANMMQHVEEMELCMQKVGKKKMAELEKSSAQIEAEVAALCQAGKRSQAQVKAISYGKKMADDPTIEAMMKCAEPMKGMMTSMPMMPFMDVSSENPDKHVCD